MIKTCELIDTDSLDKKQKKQIEIDQKLLDIPPIDRPFKNFNKSVINFVYYTWLTLQVLLLLLIFVKVYFKDRFVEFILKHQSFAFLVDVYLLKRFSVNNIVIILTIIAICYVGSYFFITNHIINGQHKPLLVVLIITCCFNLALLYIIVSESTYEVITSLKNIGKQIGFPSNAR